MEVQAVNNLHNTAALLSSLQTAASPTSTQPEAEVLIELSNSMITANAKATKLRTTKTTNNGKHHQQQQQQQHHHLQQQHSRSNSPASSNNSEEIEKELNEINLNCSLTTSGIVCESNDSISGASSNSVAGMTITTTTTNSTTTNNTTGFAAGATINGDGGTSSSTGTVAVGSVSSSSAGGITQIKKRISSSRTPTRKARRIKFYRNGDRFYPGITIPVSNERYRSFESLFEDVTRLLEENVKIPGAVRTIYTMCGKKISTLDELEDGQSYVCSCNNENFKKVDYNMTSQPLANITLTNKTSTRVMKVYRPSSPLKNGTLATVNASGIVNISSNMNNSAHAVALAVAGGGAGAVSNGSPLNSSRFSERDSVVHPRIVTLIRNGTKPRKIMRLLLNKRNSPSFDHVLTAITQVVKLDTGYVRKVFTLSGSTVQQLADFFGPEDVFFAYGTERVNNTEDFKLEPDEQKAINAIRKTLRTAGTTCKGPKPKMPVKNKKVKSVMVVAASTNSNNASSGVISSSDDKNGVLASEEQQVAALLSECDIDIGQLPNSIRDNYVLGDLIGDGNFAVVMKIKHRQTGLPYALKIIDKSKCKGKEHYIDAEVRVMKKLLHPHIISLILDIDQKANMYLVLDYVGGGDLFDAITRVTRFSEQQSRTMIRHLGSAMSYLHSMGIVHRDIKPENLLVELDAHGNVIEMKLADFGLACEVTEPLFAVCGTPTYVAPEILLEVGYGLKIDVWAAGIILYILLCGFPPFVAPDNQQEPLFDAIIAGVYEFPDPYWSDIGDGVRDLIANMLQSDPDVRFTSEDILDHYWTMGNDDGSNCLGDFNR